MGLRLTLSRLKQRLVAAYVADPVVVYSFGHAGSTSIQMTLENASDLNNSVIGSGRRPKLIVTIRRPIDWAVSTLFYDLDKQGFDFASLEAEERVALAPAWPCLSCGAKI